MRPDITEVNAVSEWVSKELVTYGVRVPVMLEEYASMKLTNQMLHGRF
jgi:hypothetical protein